MPIDEGPRPVVVDREEDDVSLADDRSDVGLVEELGDRLTGEPIVSGDPGQGLGLVRAQIALRAGLPRAVPRLGFEISSEGLKPRARYSAIDGLPFGRGGGACFTFRSQSSGGSTRRRGRSMSWPLFKVK